MQKSVKHKPMPNKVTAIAILTVLIIGIVAFGYYVYVAVPFSEYTKITVTEGQGKIVTISEYEYAFSYAHAVPTTSGATAYFYIATNLSLIGTPYKATEGTTYNAFGLEIKVSEVHDSYCILLAKSTVP